jgi:hypothetical protein
VERFHLAIVIMAIPSKNTELDEVIKTGKKILG